jgi:Helix-turn-helix domain
MMPVVAKPAHLHLVGAPAHGGEDALDQVFAALADPVRRSILSRLDGRELLVSQIAQHSCHSAWQPNPGSGPSRNRPHGHH